MLKVNVSQTAEASGDTLGGFKVWDTAIYDATVFALHFGAAKSGAQFAGVHLKIDGKDYRETIYFTNKEGNTFYTKDGKDHELPGFQTVNELCIVTTGKGLLQQPMEEKILKLYDPEAKAETNQSVPVAVDVKGAVKVAILRKIVNKQVKDPNTNAYVDTNEQREENEINKFFNGDHKFTATEYTKDQSGGSYGTFHDQWKEQYGPDKDGKAPIINRFKQVAGGGQAGMPGQTGGAAGPQGTGKSIFGG